MLRNFSTVHIRTVFLIDSRRCFLNSKKTQRTAGFLNGKSINARISPKISNPGGNFLGLLFFFFFLNVHTRRLSLVFHPYRLNAEFRWGFFLVRPQRFIVALEIFRYFFFSSKSRTIIFPGVFFRRQYFGRAFTRGNNRLYTRILNLVFGQRRHLANKNQKISIIKTPGTAKRTSCRRPGRVFLHRFPTV